MEQSPTPGTTTMGSSELRPKLSHRPLNIPNLVPNPKKRNRSQTNPIAMNLAAPAPDSGVVGVSRRKVLRELALEGDLFGQDGNVTLDPIFLRDACDCSQCVDQSTQQREFLFADIPTNIKATSRGLDAESRWNVAWENDIPGYSGHVSKYSPAQVKRLAKKNPHPIEDILSTLPRFPWTRDSIKSYITKTKHADFMNDQIALARVIRGLHRDGLAFLTNVPSDPEALGQIVERIGPLRHTFYGNTWEVRSVVNANNVAYTSKHLGFHMDLLYMDLPPAFQFLHCIQNSCSGGESRFVDTWKAVEILRETQPQHIASMKAGNVSFHYHNDGHHYRRTTRLLREANSSRTTKHFPVVSWSPPFMSGIAMNPTGEVPRSFMEASKAFAETLEREDLVFEMKMEEGTCVIFDNTRVLHARNAFDTNDGQRWLRGAYLDRCDFNSRLKMLGLEIEELEKREKE